MNREKIDITNDFDIPDVAEWEKAALKLLKGKPFKETLFTTTDEGIILKPVYFQNDSSGINLSAYMTPDWWVAQTLFSANDTFNRHARDAIKNGQNALSIDLDPVSAYGLQLPAVPGRLGLVHISQSSTFDSLFSGIDLQQIPILFDAMLTAAQISEWWLEYLKKQSINISMVRGGLGAGPIAAALRYGGLSADPVEIMRTIVTVFQAEKRLPGVDVFTIYCDQIHNAGGDVIHELSYFLSTAIFYINTLADLGIEPSRILSKIRVRTAIGPRQFMEIAKLRALRVLWGNLCRAYESDELNGVLKIDAVSSERYLSYFDPWVNMLRGSSAAFSALVGGCDSLDVLPFDWPLGLPDEFSCRQARNTQIILAEESNLLKVLDPSAGSGYLESLTREIAEKSWQRFQQIEADGGIVPRIKSGTLQKEIRARARLEEEEYALGKRKAIGSNIFPNPDEKRPAKQAARIEAGFHPVPAAWPVIPLRMERALEQFEQKRKRAANEKAS